MKYYVEAYRTRSLCKVLDVPELYDKPMLFGPWKRLKTAKAKKAAMNKERFIAQLSGEDEFRDCGPTYRNVRIIEEPSE